MGRDKATLVIDGVPLWSRQLRVLEEIRPEKIVVAARARPLWCQIEVVMDRPPSHGPLSGLAAALAELQTTHLLALAVDLPLMNSLNLRQLWSRARTGRGLIPMVGEQPEPLCAFYPMEARALAEKPLAGPDLSMRGFIQPCARLIWWIPTRFRKRNMGCIGTSIGLTIFVD